MTFKVKNLRSKPVQIKESKRNENHSLTWKGQSLKVILIARFHASSLISNAAFSSP